MALKPEIAELTLALTSWIQTVQHQDNRPIFPDITGHGESLTGNCEAGGFRMIADLFGIEDAKPIVYTFYIPGQETVRTCSIRLALL